MSDTKQDDAKRTWWRERVKRLLLSQYDSGLVAGKPHLEYFESLGFPRTKMTMGYDVVDNEFFASGAESARVAPSSRLSWLPGLDEAGPFFLACCRFIPRKNVEGLVRAYELYRDAACGPWRLVIVGEGPQMENIGEIVKGRKIPGVTLAGPQEYSKMPLYYGRAAAFVHPATTDQWGLVVNEALASGLPVIVSRGAGCSDDLVVEAQNGYTFDARSAAELAERLTRVARLKPAELQAMGAASRRIVSEWSPTRFADGLGWAMETAMVGPPQRLALSARVTLAALRYGARRTTSFYSAPA